MKREKKILFLVLFAGFILSGGLSLAEETVEAGVPGAEEAFIEAEKMLLEAPVPDVLPVPESDNNGYWWNRQDKKTKQEYVKQLIELFEVKDSKLKINSLIERMDVVYDPKDDPADIKIDLSVERIFYEVIK